MYWFTVMGVWYAAQRAKPSPRLPPPLTSISSWSNDTLVWQCRSRVMDFIEDSAEGDSLEAQSKPGVIRIILADSQAIYRVGIRKIFALEDDLRVIAQADSLDNLRGAIDRYPSDVVLLEGALLNGSTSVVSELLRAAPDAKLIVQA